MKKILIFLMVFVASLKAEVHSILIEHIPSQNVYNAVDNITTTIPAAYRITSYGELPDGKPDIKILASTGEMKLVNDFKDHSSFGGAKNFKRVWMYFHQSDVLDDKGNIINAKGSIRSVDFHLEPSPDFEAKIFNSADIDASTKVEILKSSLESN